VDYGGPVVGFYTPGLGRSRTEEWMIEGGHFAERCWLFVIIALGESILVTGMTFGESEASAITACALVVAFLGSVALWWTYFDRTEGLAPGAITSSENPGLTALSAYTYSHVPMIAEIIAVAAADELVVTYPGVQGTLASVALTLGGTGLFVAGQALFKWAVLGVRSWSRVVALAALIALVPVGFAMPALALSGAAGLIVAGLAVWETLGHRAHVRSQHRSTP
jgi:low temperature requirement protein LtrA